MYYTNKKNTADIEAEGEIYTIVYIFGSINISFQYIKPTYFWYLKRTVGWIEVYRLIH